MVPAEVQKVHTNGKCDMKYMVDGKPVMKLMVPQDDLRFHIDVDQC